jgi:hypothetical protein
LVLIEPLRPGEHEPTITPEQIELEDEMLRAWQDYLTKRDAYLEATTTPEPADGVNPEKRRRDIGGVCIAQIGTSVTGRKIGVPARHVSDGFGTGRSSDGAGRRAQR